MENIGCYHLLASHFIIGSRETKRKFTKTETPEIEALHKFFDFMKKEGEIMTHVRLEKIMCVQFLEIIELDDFKLIVEGLYETYQNCYKYSTKLDFINHVFGYTISALKKFLKQEPNSSPYTIINGYSFYMIFILELREYSVFIIKEKNDKEHYIQYYKAVLEYLHSFSKPVKTDSKNELNFNNPMSSTPPQNEPNTIDLSNTKGTEKIVMLQKLGVLDFLKDKKPFSTSTNSLASVISGITGIEQRTVQSYINPMFNESVSQKNNPLKTKKTVDAVTLKLNSLGYNSNN